MLMSGMSGDGATESVCRVERYPSVSLWSNLFVRTAVKLEIRIPSLLFPEVEARGDVRRCLVGRFVSSFLFLQLVGTCEIGSGVPKAEAKATHQPIHIQATLMPQPEYLAGEVWHCSGLEMLGIKLVSTSNIEVEYQQERVAAPGSSDKDYNPNLTGVYRTPIPPPLYIPPRANIISFFGNPGTLEQPGLQQLECT